MIDFILAMIVIVAITEYLPENKKERGYDQKIAQKHAQMDKEEFTDNKNTVIQEDKTENKDNCI